MKLNLLLKTITEEVLEEALEHQFFFTPTNGIATVVYTDN